MKRLLAAAALAFVVSALGSACSSQGGGPPQAPCGSPCVAKCGCKTCVNGDLFESGSAKYICQGGCFDPLALATDGGDAGASDAAPDVDCTGVACEPTAICGQCTAPCGCCGCTNGEFKTIDGKPYVCLVNCFTPFELEAGGI